MQTHAKMNRRSRGYKGKDENLYLSTQGEDMRSETYTHPVEISHHSGSYRAKTSSRHSSYDTSREAPTFRNRSSELWRHRELDDRFKADDVYLRHSRGRDEYDLTETRELEDWSEKSTMDHRHSRSEFYGRGYVSSCYGETSSRKDSLHHERRDASSSSYDLWMAEEFSGERLRGLEAEDDQLDQAPYDWRREHHQQRGLQKLRNHTGWEIRRPRNWDAPTRDRVSSGRQNTNQADRSWEPAPAWRASNRGGEKDNSDRSSKGSKRPTHSKWKRDWRTDDGTLNNWTRRTSRYCTTPKKKNSRFSSHSRSHSRSPTGSHYSHHSWNRSRSGSASPSPKRRRRDAAPVSHSRMGERESPGWFQPSHQMELSLSPRRSPSGRLGWTSDKGLSSQSHHRHHCSSLSPKRSPEESQARRRSISSSSSKSRSTSRSPPRARAIHRLPLSSTVMSPSSSATLSGSYAPRRFGDKRNGLRPYMNGNFTDKRRKVMTSSCGSHDSMPPPNVIPASLNIRSLHSPNHRPCSLHEMEKEYSPVSLTARPNFGKHPARFVPIGQPSPKPISKTSSSLKRFFPAEDDDVENDSQVRQVTTFGGPLLQPRGSVSRNDPVPTVDAIEREIVTAPAFEGKEVPFEEDQTLLANDPDEHRRSFVRDEVCVEEKTPTPAPSSNSRGALYSIVSQVGEGTFGKVYKAQNTLTKVHVALKKIRMEAEKDGFPVTAMREIKLLQTLQHPNVVRLYEIMISNGFIYMVFEYMDHDLTGILSQSQFTFSDAHLKSLCHQMLAGLAYLHHKSVIHRDIKGSNILINNRGELKLADFGLARFYQKRRRSDYTNRVITLWYRPPELLFGATIYGPEVDMWSAGCIMLELFTRKPVFQGNDEIHQLEVVYKIIGTLTPERWLGVMDLPWYELMKPKEVIANHFRELFRKWMSPAALDLAEQLLSYDPSLRATAIQAMSAPYFTQELPKASLPVGLATLEGEWHELETKRERARRRRKIENVA